MKRNTKKYIAGFAILWGMGLLGLCILAGMDKMDRVHATTITSPEASAAPQVSPTPVGDGASVDELNQQITDVQDAKKRLEQQKKDLKDSISSLKEKKSDLLEYIEELDKEVMDLQERIAETKKEVKATRKELKQLQTDLKQAEENRQKQYDIMKERIQYMYENGTEGYIEMVLKSSDLSDLLSRVEYVSQISTYDKNVFDNYVNMVGQVSAMEAEVSRKLVEIEEKKDGLTLDKEYLEKMMADKNSEMKTYANKLKQNKKDLTATEEEVAKQEELVDKLLEQQRKKIQEEMDRQEAAARESGDSSQMPVITDGNTAGFRWPLVIAGEITSPFGRRNSPTAGASSYHRGIDIGAPTGTQIVASKDGTVVSSEYQSGAGNYVALYHGNGTYTYYMHCSRLAVNVGDKVKQGQVIAYVGSTGISTGPHLHFAIVMNEQYVDPQQYVSP